MILFLDIDGVLKRYTGTKDPNPIDGLDDFVPEAVEALNELIRVLGAQIVIISSWRIGKTTETLQDILEIRGVEGKVIGKTNYLYSAEGRGQEIREWMEENGFPENFLILDDDMTSIDNQFKNCYKIDPRTCLRMEDIPVILKMLNK